MCSCKCLAVTLVIITLVGSGIAAGFIGYKAATEESKPGQHPWSLWILFSIYLIAFLISLMGLFGLCRNIGCLLLPYIMVMFLMLILNICTLAITGLNYSDKNKDEQKQFSNIMALVIPCLTTGGYLILVIILLCACAQLRKGGGGGGQQ
ncbi:hypothetical protein L596_024725 [Steinernema carpocapsae]|uniref:Tetraspanin n=1 Tax=Steinernema carpocapsae TaxID=34508 RepID=A0A4U5M6H6_STECR|nr:hypothetical protein L596_024725 [Steinernema carpocapsae]